MKTSSLALGWQRLERLVVLVDVQVFAQGNVNASQAYAALIHSSIERVLAVCNEHNTGHKRSTSWSYKLFDSSLSPSASSSALQKLLKDLSGGQKQIGRFKSAVENLGLFQQTLSTVAAEVDSKCDPSQPTRSKADFVVRALQELLSDFNWNSVFISDGSSSDEDQARRRGERQVGTPFSSQQNLVIVFSQLPDNMEQFASFMNMPTPARDTELFKVFSSKMKRLQEPFRLQGIRACWIDMPHVSTPLTSQARRPPAFTEPYREPQRPELHAVFAQTKWKYTTMDALAIASDCIPPPMLWFSVVHPDLQVQPNAHRMQCKLRISVQGRDGAQLQPEVCRLEAVSLGSNVVDSALMKESVSAMLKLGSLSSKAERLHLVNCPSLQPPIVKIVVKSLILKHDVSSMCSLRYLLYHRVECGADYKKKNSMALAENKELKLDPLADDVAPDVYGHDILQQLQQEPMSFEPGDRAWQVLLLAIARKNSVAEVDLYIDGDCSSAILEPITLQYAALLQKNQSSQPLSADCNKQFRVQKNGSKLLVASALLQPVLKSGEDARVEGSECSGSKQGTRPKKRPASSISVIDGPLVKREKTECGSKQKPICAEEMKHTKREAYSWIQHWRYILHRKSVGTGRVQIENRYMRPGPGKKPSKAISIIKCWLDLVSKPKPLTALQIVPFSLAAPGPAEPDAGILMLEGGFSHLESAERVGQADNSVVPLGGKGLFSAILDTEEQAESYLSSIEQMLQDCLQSDAGDLQVFVKGIMSNATRAQRILLKKKQALDLVHPSDENMQCPIKGDSTQVHNSAQKNMERREAVKPCNSDSSCASNLSKAEKVDHKNELTLAMRPEMLISVSGVGNCVMPDGNAIEYGGSSDGADSGGQTNEAILLEMVAGQLMDKLLVKPKKLARQYSNCESATSDFVHIRQEKLRAYELQILFRMELIERDCGGPLEKEKSKILKEICKLLDDIQFDLGGGIFGGEGLHDYSIRVIHNSYKERLPQTVADIFERMEFNGYVEGVSELQPAPDSTHADLVRSHVQKESEREELTDKFTTMEAVTGSFVPVVQPVEEIGENGAIPTSKKGPSKTRRKRSVPIDAFTRASEKRKLASRLAHFGGPDSLHRLKKIKIHHQSPKPSKVTSPAIEKSSPKEHNIVLETPRFERQNVRAESPNVVHEDNEVESICTRVLPSAFGFGTPARVSKHMPTTRKRRQALFKEKKPPGRGLPRISLDVMKAMAEDQILHQPAKPDCHLDVECLAHNDCAGESSSMYVSQSSQEQRLPDPGWRREPLADILKNTRTSSLTFDSTDLTEWGFRGDQGRPEKNDITAENSRRTGLERLGSVGRAHPLILDAQLETQIIQEDDCHPARVTTTQVGIHHDSNNGTLINADMPVPSRKNRRKAKHASRSKKPGLSGDCSKPRTSAPASQILSPVAVERDLLGLGGARQEPVQTVEQSDMVENSQPVDLTSLENRWNDEEIPCTLPTEVPMGVSGYRNAQHTLVETESIEMAGVSEPNGGLSRFEELAFRSSPKALLTNRPELCSETEVLFETEIVEEIHSQKHSNRSPGRAVSEDALSLSTSDFPITWEMPCMDLNETQDFEQEDRVGISQMISTTDKSASSGSRSLQPLRINQTSKVCRVDPPSSPWLDRLAAEHDEPLVKTHGLIAGDLSVDPDFSQLVKEIFQSTPMMDEACAEDCQGRKLDDSGEYLDEYSLLLDENWSPQPRLKPEARLSAILEEDAVAVVTGGSPIKFSSPSQSRKCRRPSEGSPGQYLNTPNAVVNSKRRPRSNSASPNPTKIKMLRFA